MMAPAVVIRPILPALSANLGGSSGPAVMLKGALLGVRSGIYSKIAVAAEPLWKYGARPPTKPGAEHGYCAAPTRRPTPPNSFWIVF